MLHTGDLSGVHTNMPAMTGKVLSLEMTMHCKVLACISAVPHKSSSLAFVIYIYAKKISVDIGFTFKVKGTQTIQKNA